MGSEGFGYLKKYWSKKAVKGQLKQLKKLHQSDVGKAALIGAAAFGIPGRAMGGFIR